MQDKTSNAFEIIRHWNDLPDDALVQSKVTALVLGVSERTARYHPHLPHRQISRGRYGQRVGDVRKLMRGEFEPIGVAARRVVESCAADIRDHGRRMQRELDRQREKGE